MLQDHRVDVLGQGAVQVEFAWPTPPVLHLFHPCCTAS